MQTDNKQQWYYNHKINKVNKINTDSVLSPYLSNQKKICIL